MADAMKLLPCPFCGGEAEIVHVDDGEDMGGSCVSCTKCQASGNMEFGFKENFVSNWNRRASPPAPAREGVVKACAVFQEAIDYFEADVADVLAESSERADLWDREITVNIDTLKAVMAAALASREEADDLTATIGRIKTLANGEEAPAEGAGEWPVITDDWIRTYCELTGRDPDGGSVTFLGDGPVSTTFKEVARREIDAMLCAAPKSTLRARTSEPEAGESLDEAARRLFAAQYPGRDYDDLKADTKIGWLRSAHKELCHPATATADKLRVAKESLERIEGLPAEGMPDYAASIVARQALAALTEEGGV